MTPGPPKGGALYPVWYGTNRVPLDIKNEKAGYSSQVDRKTYFGKVLVEIPEDYLAGYRNQNWLQRLFLSSSENRLQVRSLLPISADEFLKDIQDAVKRKTPDDRVALIFLHGFKTTFEEAAERAASIGYQLKVPITAFFSWPSKGAVAGYVADSESARLSSDELATFLVKIARDSGANRVHIVAHSMGSHALLEAMQRPAMRLAMSQGVRFGQIILAAPDVNKGIFERDASVYTQVADRVTMYVSAKDVALTASKGLADFPRAGLMPPPTIVRGIETMDVSAVNLSALGHAYVADEIVVLEDIAKLISHNEPPIRRTRVRLSRDATHWILN